jgi:predicted transcriptional regulator
VASNKPPIVQAAVIAKHMLGESKTQIAEDLGMSRVTINGILNETELNDIVMRGKADVYRMIPEAISGIRKAIKRGKTTEEAQLVLRSTGVLAPEQSGAPSVNVNFGVFGGE